MYAIEAKGLVKQFDGFHAVDGVDLKIPEGSIFGILGPNGAGKTTMLRTLLGIIDPDAGTRSLLGSDRPITQSRNVGYLPEERGLYQSMRAVDTIAFMGALRGLSLKEGAKKGRALFAILLLRLGVYLFKKNVMKSGSAGRAKDDGARRLFGFIKMPG
jgi:ABC-2 type transport system ATP-binding protein